MPLTDKPYKRLNLSSLKGKKIINVEEVKGGRLQSSYLRVWIGKKKFFDVAIDYIFDEEGMLYENDLPIPF